MSQHILRIMAGTSSGPVLVSDLMFFKCLATDLARIGTNDGIVEFDNGTESSLKGTVNSNSLDFLAIVSESRSALDLESMTHSPAEFFSGGIEDEEVFLCNIPADNFHQSLDEVVFLSITSLQKHNIHW